MLRLRDEAAHRMSELQNLSSGSLSIAAHESAALYLLPGPMRQYFERFPDIKVSVHRSRPMRFRVRSWTARWTSAS